MLKFGLMMMLIGCAVIIFVSFSGAVGAARATGQVKSDDNKPEESYCGRVLEKKTEIYDPGSIGVKIKMEIEWIIFEDDQGERRRFRNIRKDIMIASGDRGIITVRGETIYSFQRENK